MKKKFNQNLFYKNKFLVIFICLLLYFIIKSQISNNNLLIYNINDYHTNQTYNYSELFNSTNLAIKKKSILLFELNAHHFECSPGYIKYFIDLGFYVDLLIRKKAKNAFVSFGETDKIRFFLYNNLDQINLISHNLSIYMNNYDFIIIQTIDTNVYKNIAALGLINNNKAIFICHDTYFYHVLKLYDINNQNRIWTLGNFNIGSQVVPFYFGNFKLRDKNKKTRFLTVSTIYRNYSFLISASERIKKENLDFEIIVVGQKKYLTAEHFNNKTRDNIILIIFE